MPPSFTPAGTLMQPHLDQCAFPVYCIAFKITDYSADEWTARFIKFKTGQGDELQQAIRGAVAVLAHGLPHLSLQPPVGMVSAIGSAATSLVAGSALDKLGAALAAQMSWRWLSAQVAKQAHNPLHNIFNGAARDAEVAGKYRCGDIPKELRTLVILDDLVTRGSTMNDVGRAVRASGFAGHLVGVALGKTEREAYWADAGGISNSHVPAGLAEKWDNA